MAIYEDAIVIYRPVADVWRFMTDPTNAPQWDTGILAGRQVSPGPMGVGTRIEATRALFGRRTTLRCQMAEYEPEHTFRLVFDPFGPVRRLEARYTFEPTQDGAATRLTKWTLVETGGPLGLLGALLRRMGQRENAGDLENVKHVLEAATMGARG